MKKKDLKKAIIDVSLISAKLSIAGNHEDASKLIDAAVILDELAAFYWKNKMPVANEQSRS